MAKFILFIKLIGAFAFTGGVSGCGVKGDPLPPLRPAELGRGRPTYKRAARKVQITERIGEGAKPMPSAGEKEKTEDEE